MVDVSKIRPGDKVTIEAEVVESGRSGLYVCVSTPDGDLYLNASLITAHRPAPRPIAVGCKVRFVVGLKIGKVLSMPDDNSWVLVQWDLSTFPTVCRTDDLKHAEEP